MNDDAYIILEHRNTEDAGMTGLPNAEVFELSWQVVSVAPDQSVRTSRHTDQVVKPSDTMISPDLAVMLGYDNPNVFASAPRLRDALSALDQNLAALGLQNKDFKLVMIDSTNFKSRLQRESVERDVQVPGYFKYASVIDLSREFTRLTGQGEFDLGEMARVLSIPVTQGHGPLKRGDFRANSQVTIARHAFLQMLGRGHQFRPEKRKADWSWFIKEESQVIHMRNLPHPVNEHELENWFGNHHKKPLALWTLQIAASAQPNQSFAGTGFAVFKSHHDALYAIECMNGRELNGNLVQVSPSCNEVVQKARVVLTFFPSHQIDPKPGDWLCPCCGFINFQRRSACLKCQELFSDAATVYKKRGMNIVPEIPGPEESFRTRSAGASNQNQLSRYMEQKQRISQTYSQLWGNNSHFPTQKPGSPTKPSNTTRGNQPVSAAEPTTARNTIAINNGAFHLQLNGGQGAPSVQDGAAQGVTSGIANLDTAKENEPPVSSGHVITPDEHGPPLAKNTISNQFKPITPPTEPAMNGYTAAKAVHDVKKLDTTNEQEFPGLGQPKRKTRNG